MKNIILVFAALNISVVTYAQTDSMNVKMSPPDIHNTNDGLPQNRDMNGNQNRISPQQPDTTWKLEVDDKAKPDGVMMKNGKLMIVRDGKENELTKEITLSNGTKIMSDGTYIIKGGTKIMLNEGEFMNMSGQFIPKYDAHPKNK